MYNENTNNKMELAFSFLDNDAGKSLLLFNEVLDVCPENVKALNGKASALLKLNHIDEADKVLDKSLSISETSNAYINKGIICKKNSEYEKALTYYNKALKLNKNLIGIIGILKKEIQEYLNDEEIENNSKKFSPEVQKYIHEAMEYKKMDKLWDALDYFELAINCEPSIVKYLTKELNDIKKGLQKEFLVKQPKKEDSFYQLKIKIFKDILRNYQRQALIKCDEILDINNRDLDALNIKGIILFYLNDYGEALKCFDKCLLIDSNYIFALFNKSLILRRMKDYAGARNCLNKIININNISPDLDIYREGMIEKLNVILDN